MTPNEILLYSQISTLLSHHQKSFLLQQMGTNTETHSQKLCREKHREMERGREGRRNGERETIRHKSGCHNQISPFRAKDTAKEGRQKVNKRQKGQRTPRKQGSLNPDYQSSYELTETEEPGMWPVQIGNTFSVLMASRLMFFMGFQSVQMCGFSWTPFLPLVCLVQIQCVSFCFILFYFVIFFK